MGGPISNRWRSWISTTDPVLALGIQQRKLQFSVMVPPTDEPSPSSHGDAGADPDQTGW